MMAAEAEDSQHHPLAPTSTYGRSDEESAADATTTTTAQKTPIKFSRHDHSSKWLVYVLEAIVITSAVMLIFSSAFMRVETPSAKIISVSIDNLKHGNSSSASLSVTLNTVVRIRNTNFGRFVLDNATTTVIVLYDEEVIGYGGVSWGRRVKSRGTEKVSVAVEVGSEGRLDTNKSMNLSSDIEVGIVELRSYAKLSGKVHLMYDFVKKREKPELNCTMNLNLTSKAIQDLLCN